MMRLAYLAIAVIYGISPVDLIPDIAPPVTYADDAVVGIVMMILALRRKGK